MGLVSKGVGTAVKRAAGKRTHKPLKKHSTQALLNSWERNKNQGMSMSEFLKHYNKNHNNTTPITAARLKSAVSNVKSNRKGSTAKKNDRSAFYGKSSKKSSSSSKKSSAAASTYGTGWGRPKF